MIVYEIEIQIKDVGNPFADYEPECYASTIHPEDLEYMYFDLECVESIIKITNDYVLEPFDNNNVLIT